MPVSSRPPGQPTWGLTRSIRVIELALLTPELQRKDPVTKITAEGWKDFTQWSRETYLALRQGARREEPRMIQSISNRETNAVPSSKTGRQLAEPP